MKLLLLILFASFLFVFILNDEAVEAHFSNYNQASQNGIIPSDTWLPAFLPKTASDIKERHNLDTNETWVHFRFGGNERFGLTNSCETVAIEKIMFPREDRSSMSWWRDFDKSDFEFYRCDKNSFMAVAKKNDEAFFWRLAR